MANTEETLLTVEGKKRYEEELDHLINVVRPQVTQEIKEAKEQGDLSENADYDAARNKQGEVEARITFLDNLLKHSRLISSSDATVVSLGNKVTIYIEDEDVTEDYYIVGPAEADPENGKISNECQLAQAIIGHKVDEEVTVKVASPYKVVIKAIA